VAHADPGGVAPNTASYAGPVSPLEQGADWIDEQRHFAADWLDRQHQLDKAADDRLLDANPNNPLVAGYVPTMQSIKDINYSFGLGQVANVLRVGDGVAKGTPLGYVEDAGRALTVLPLVHGLATAGAATGEASFLEQRLQNAIVWYKQARPDMKGFEAPCVPMTVGGALATTGAQPMITMAEVCDQIGLPAAARAVDGKGLLLTGTAEDLPAVLDTLVANGAEAQIVTPPALQDVGTFLQSQPIDSVAMVGVRYSAATVTSMLTHLEQIEASAAGQSSAEMQAAISAVKQFVNSNWDGSVGQMLPQLEAAVQHLPLGPDIAQDLAVFCQSQTEGHMFEMFMGPNGTIKIGDSVGQVFDSLAELEAHYGPNITEGWTGVALVVKNSTYLGPWLTTRMMAELDPVTRLLYLTGVGVNSIGADPQEARALSAQVADELAQQTSAAAATTDLIGRPLTGHTADQPSASSPPAAGPELLGSPQDPGNSHSIGGGPAPSPIRLQGHIEASDRGGSQADATDPSAQGSPSDTGGGNGVPSAGPGEAAPSGTSATAETPLVAFDPTQVATPDPVTITTIHGTLPDPLAPSDPVPQVAPVREADSAESSSVGPLVGSVRVDQPVVPVDDSSSAPVGGAVPVDGGSEGPLYSTGSGMVDDQGNAFGTLADPGTAPVPQADSAESSSVGPLVGSVRVDQPVVPVDDSSSAPVGGAVPVDGGLEGPLYSTGSGMVDDQGNAFGTLADPGTDPAGLSTEIAWSGGSISDGGAVPVGGGSEVGGTDDSTSNAGVTSGGLINWLAPGGEDSSLFADDSQPGGSGPGMYDDQGNAFGSAVTIGQTVDDTASRGAADRLSGESASGAPANTDSPADSPDNMEIKVDDTTGRPYAESSVTGDSQAIQATGSDSSGNLVYEAPEQAGGDLFSITVAGSIVSGGAEWQTSPEQNPDSFSGGAGGSWSESATSSNDWSGATGASSSDSGGGDSGGGNSYSGDSSSSTSGDSSGSSYTDSGGGSTDSGGSSTDGGGVSTDSGGGYGGGDTSSGASEGVSQESAAPATVDSSSSGGEG
jgi:hypothetical protein